MDRTERNQVLGATMEASVLLPDSVEDTQSDGENESVTEPDPKKSKVEDENIAAVVTKCLLSNVRNIRKKENYAHLYMQLERESPDLVVLNETWLTAATEEVAIPGYRSTARRDRSLGAKTKGGGVDVYCKKNIHHMVLLHESKVAERTWSVLHSDIGPILIVNWYRAGDEPLDVESF